MEKNEYFILIACDEFQRVTKAFHDLGFTNTFSCDIGESLGDIPAFHFDFDTLDIRKNSNPHFKHEYIFRTMDGAEHKLQRVDMVIIALESMSASYRGSVRAIQFVNFMYNLPAPFKVIESPFFPEKIASFWGSYIEHCEWYDEYLQTRGRRIWN